ncbi:hypothetical protein, partial [Burkholderia cepacia]|uniref:hypothetical protein n=1 Tax=Burkholderia cepacia TaxID=292 RepID=UPI00197EC095
RVPLRHPSDTHHVRCSPIPTGTARTFRRCAVTETGMVTDVIISDISTNHDKFNIADRKY